MVAFRVTEKMLEVVDDYLRGYATNEDARKGLQRHFPKLTRVQIQKVIKLWHKQTAEGE